MSERAQQQIPGTEPPSIAEVEEAAENYRTFRDERMKLQEKETEAQKALVAVMQSRNLKTYRYEDGAGVARIVRMRDQIKAQVAKFKDGGDSGDADSN